MQEVLRGARLNPSTSTCEFALFSVGSKAKPLSPQLLCLQKIAQEAGVCRPTSRPHPRQSADTPAQLFLGGREIGDQGCDQLLLHYLTLDCNLGLPKRGSLSTGQANGCRNLGSGLLFWVHAGAGGEAHADCPAVSLYFSWSIEEASLRGQPLLLSEQLDQSQRQEKNRQG